MPCWFATGNVGNLRAIRSRLPCSISNSRLRVLSRDFSWGIPAQVARTASLRVPHDVSRRAKATQDFEGLGLASLREALAVAALRPATESPHGPVLVVT